MNAVKTGTLLLIYVSVESMKSWTRSYAQGFLQLLAKAGGDVSFRF